MHTLYDNMHVRTLIRNRRDSCVKHVATVHRAIATERKCNDINCLSTLALLSTWSERTRERERYRTREIEIDDIHTVHSHYIRKQQITRYDNVALFICYS